MDIEIDLRRGDFEAMHPTAKKALGDNYVSFADIAVVLGEAQEQKG